MELDDKTLIDLEVVRGLVDMEDVLEHYGVRSQFVEKNGVLFGPSPLNGNGYRGAEPSLKVGLSSRRWYSYGPDSRGGDTLEFVAEKESVDLWNAADRILEWFEYKQEYLEVKNSSEEQYGTTNGAPEIEPERDSGHESVRRLGLRRETMDYFNAGYCAEGKLEGRIVIPLHSEFGKLLGYTGRRIDDGDGPLYKYVSKTGENTSVEEITSKYGLYNLHRAIDSAEYNFTGSVSVVVDIIDVFRLYESGIENVVAMLLPDARGKQVEELTFCTSLYDDWRKVSPDNGVE